MENLINEIDNIGGSEYGSSMSEFKFVSSPKKTSPKKKKAVKKSSPKKASPKKKAVKKTSPKASPKKKATPRKKKDSGEKTLAQLRKEYSDKKIKGCYVQEGKAVSKAELIKLLQENDKNSVEKFAKKRKAPVSHLYSKKECTEMGEAVQTCIEDGLITKTALSEIIGQTQKIKKEKKKKDEDKPKRPTTAFFYFSKAKREDVKKDLGTKSVTEVAKRLGELWRGMSSSQKEKFEALAKKDKKRYEKEMENYKQ